MQHGGKWYQMESPGGNLVLELNYYPRGNRFYEPIRPGTEMDHLGFLVDDLDSWVDRALSAGAKRVVEWTESRWRLAYLKDPDGIWLEFIGRNRPPSGHEHRLLPRQRQARRDRVRPD